MKTKTVTDEQIVSALLCNDTKQEAAAAVGLTARAMRDRLSDPECAAVYAAAKAAVVRNALSQIAKSTGQAIKTITDIMNDPEADPGIRLRAANTILTNTAKFSEVLQSADRAAGEAAERAEESSFLFR